MVLPVDPDNIEDLCGWRWTHPCIDLGTVLLEVSKNLMAGSPGIDGDHDGIFLGDPPPMEIGKNLMAGSPRIHGDHDGVFLGDPPPMEIGKNLMAGVSFHFHPRSVVAGVRALRG
ncbi:unnamed protein product [Urochloa humidicola]